MAQRKGQMRVIYLSDIIETSDDGIIIRPPKDEEIRQAATNPSDYQMGRIKYMSKVLSDLEILPAVYNSKKAVIEKSTEARAKKIEAIIEKVSPYFNNEMPLVTFFKELTNSNINLHNKYEVCIPSVLYEAKKWKDITYVDEKLGYSEELMMRLGTILRNTYGADRNLIQQQYNSQVGSIFNQNSETYVAREITGDKNYEPTQEEVDRMKRIYIKLLSYFKSVEKDGRFDTPAAFVNYINAIDSFNAILNEELMKGFVSPDVNITVGEYIELMKTYINHVKTPGERRNTMTVMIDIAKNNLKELHDNLIKNGYKSGVSDINNFFEYIKVFKPYLINNLNETYGLDEVMLSKENFATYESFFDYFYTPDMIRTIDAIVYPVKRARCKDALRKGAELAVDYALYEKRKSAINNRMGNTSTRRKRSDARTAEELEELIEAKMKERDALRESLLCSSEESALIIKEKITQIGRKIANYKNTLKSREVKSTVEVKSDKDKIKDITDKQNLILNKVRNRISSSNELFDLKTEYGYKEVTLSEEDSIIGGDMYTYSFLVKTKKNEVCESIYNILTETFNPNNDKPYNIAVIESEEISNAKEVIIDYPKKSPLFKMFKAKPEMGLNIIKMARAEVAKRIGIKPAIIEDEEYINMNKPFDFIKLI